MTSLTLFWSSLNFASQSSSSLVCKILRISSKSSFCVFATIVSPKFVFSIKFFILSMISFASFAKTSSSILLLAFSIAITDFISNFFELDTRYNIFNKLSYTPQLSSSFLIVSYLVFILLITVCSSSVSFAVTILFKRSVAVVFKLLHVSALAFAFFLLRSSSAFAAFASASVICCIFSSFIFNNASFTSLTSELVHSQISCLPSNSFTFLLYNSSTFCVVVKSLNASFSVFSIFISLGCIQS